MNIIKKLNIIATILSFFLILSCSKDHYFSGISENSMNQVNDSYLNKDYTKEEIIKIIGAPLVKENSGNLWIYRIEKKEGNASFKKNIYNKTLKLKFENDILRSVEEVVIY